MNDLMKKNATPTPPDEAPGTAAGESAGPDALAPEPAEELKARAAKAEEHWERYVRTAADFENFKKRAAREREDMARYAHQSLLGRLIPVLDNFESALAAAQTAQAGSADSLKTGVNMILEQFKSVLAEAGLEEIDATGQAFNPSLHEAVSQQETSDVPEGQVVQQLRKGYRLRDRLLRPATVVVSKKAAA